MPIGSYNHRLTRNPFKRALRRVFGTPDLHSHLRVRPVLDYVLDYVDQLPSVRTSCRIRVLELGCGYGINLFELAERLPNLDGIGYDLNADAVASAVETAARLFPERLSFRLADACREETGGGFDLVLLIDFLEHVPNPKEILRRVSESLRPGGKVLVSVPTPRYPRVFGQAFHEAVGHLVDGYDLITLGKLVPEELKLVQYRYNTGLVASLLCALYYRVLRRLPDSLPAALVRLCTVPFTSVDVLNGPGRSCSLFAAYQKDGVSA